MKYFSMCPIHTNRKLLLSSKTLVTRAFNKYLNLGAVLFVVEYLQSESSGSSNHVFKLERICKYFSLNPRFCNNKL